MFDTVHIVVRSTVQHVIDRDVSDHRSRSQAAYVTYLNVEVGAARDGPEDDQAGTVDNDGLGEPISLSTYYSSGSGFLTAIIIPEEDVLLPLPLFLLVWCFEGSELMLNLRAFGVV
jgi:hypothetical protein